VFSLSYLAADDRQDRQKEYTQYDAAYQATHLVGSFNSVDNASAGVSIDNAMLA
jgi:hypothetical protein